MTPPDPSADVVLVLRPVRDPQEAGGLPARDATIRLRLALKTLLRSFGLKAVAVRNPQPADPTPAEEAPDAPAT